MKEKARVPRCKSHLSLSRTSSPSNRDEDIPPPRAQGEAGADLRGPAGPLHPGEPEERPSSSSSRTSTGSTRPRRSSSTTSSAGSRIPPSSSSSSTGPSTPTAGRASRTTPASGWTSSPSRRAPNSSSRSSRRGSGPRTPRAHPQQGCGQSPLHGGADPQPPGERVHRDEGPITTSSSDNCPISRYPTRSRGSSRPAWTDWRRT